jgi:tetratricopeptide (TPR) repeat protein
MPTKEDQAATYRDFRAAFDAARYADARGLAEKAVSIGERLDGADSLALVTPLNNLGQTAYRLKDYVGAEQAYLRSVKVLETHDAASARLPQALYVLGKIYREANQLDFAAASLRRAVDITRKNQGLFSTAQLTFLMPLIDAYVNSGNTADADREEQYLLRIAERNYPPQDARYVAAVERQARWLETQGKFTSARRLYGRAIELSRNAGGPGDIRQVEQLRSVSRTFRLEFAYGPEAAEQNTEPRESAEFSNPLGTGSQVSRVNPDAERYLQEALKIAAASKDAAALREKIDTLIELGDLHFVQGQRSNAEKQYLEAWSALSQVERDSGVGNPLAVPQLLVYRPPSAALKKHKDDATPIPLVLSFTVGADGKVTDPKIISGTAPEVVQKSVLAAIRRTLYRPRLLAGKLAPTDNMQFHQLVYAGK